MFIRFYFGSWELGSRCSGSSSEIHAFHPLQKAQRTGHHNLELFELGRLDNPAPFTSNRSRV
jgi:hypothetical protein